MGVGVRYSLGKEETQGHREKYGEKHKYLTRNFVLINIKKRDYFMLMDSCLTICKSNLSCLYNNL